MRPQYVFLGGIRYTRDELDTLDTISISLNVEIADVLVLLDQAGPLLRRAAMRTKRKGTVATK